MKIKLKKMIVGAILISSTMWAFAAPKFNSKKSISVLSREDGFIEKEINRLDELKPYKFLFEDILKYL